jgi:hypothetical protein
MLESLSTSGLVVILIILVNSFTAGAMDIEQPIMLFAQGSTWIITGSSGTDLKVSNLNLKNIDL